MMQPTTAAGAHDHQSLTFSACCLCALFLSQIEFRGKDSPGPIYAVRSSFDKQVETTKSSSASVRLDTTDTRIKVRVGRCACLGAATLVSTRCCLQGRVLRVITGASKSACV